LSRYLIDVNVVIALIDPVHVHHGAAHAWFGRLKDSIWATCPLVENGAIRIVGHPRYTNSPGSPAAVMPSLRGLRNLPGHEFWADDLSSADGTWVDRERLLDSAQVTDTYLLALARSKNARLTTFDRKLVTNAVPDGRRVLNLIE
jgi:toxin-antitoxin system PIN domain toxin